jgi:thioredoxin-related protein
MRAVRTMRNGRNEGSRTVAWLLAGLFAVAPAQALHREPDPAAENDNEYEVFYDAPLPEPIAYPAWFKLSFLDFADDLDEAVADGKRGLLVYFGQKHCAYCEKLLEVNFGEKADIVDYTRKYFDVVGMDIHGQRSVTGFDGEELSEREFALKQKIDFTPTLVFYDRERREALRLSGYYPPYKFRAALEFVADGFYTKEDFRSYLARADVPEVFGEGELNHQDFFSPAPHALDRSKIAAQRPLVVFFEQSDCHACDILHTGPLRDEAIVERFSGFDATQLNMWAETPVITPDGRRTSARKWADQLGLFYSPSLLFFDENGNEIVRVDSVVQFYRLRNVLDYVLSDAYREYPTFQQWRRATRH